MFKNYVDEGEWDFRGSNTKEYTHCFHIYPAIMIPQIARKLIELYGQNASLLFDPYCGTGTSLVEGRLAGLNVVGTDLNPTARFISKSKIENYDVDLYALEKEMNKFLDNLEEELAGLTEDFSRFDEPKGVTFERLERWFPPRSISEVSFCLEKLNRIGLNATNKNFILVALSECLRLISYQRNNEFKLYRIPEEKRELHDVPVYNLLKDRIDRNVKGVHDFMEKVISSTKSNVQAFNTVEYDGLELIGGNPDLVVTSPPYGDSATTVAYAQFSWMTNVWLGFDSRPPGALDRDLMGGRRTEITDFGFKPMDDAIAKISIEDAKRASEVMDFIQNTMNPLRMWPKLLPKTDMFAML